MTTFVHRYHLLAASAGAREAARRLCCLVRGRGLNGDGEADPTDPEYQTCDAELVPVADPTGPTVGWAMSTAVTEAERQVLEAVEAGGQIPADLFYARSDWETGRLLATNHPLWSGRVAAGEVLTFDLDYTLDQLGLAFRRPAGP